MKKLINLYNEAEKEYNQLLIYYLKKELIYFFPLHIRFSKPNIKEDREIIKQKNDYLIENSKSKKGYGYIILWKETIKTKMQGDFTAPENIYFEDIDDYLKFIDKEKDYDLFKQNVEFILSEVPQLKNWIVENVNAINSNSENWLEILKVCRYFMEKYEPTDNLYIRELPIEIHTKFIEENKSLFDSIFTSVLPKYKINDKFKGIKNFEKRYFLNFNHTSIRFRILDINMYINNISDLSVLISEFENLYFACENIFITENLMNFLAFPKIHKSIVIWGEGNKVIVLQTINWLKDKQIFYWGDLDFAGLHILSELREHFPHVNSILMNVDIFEKYYNFRVIPYTLQKRNFPKYLNNEELKLFNKLIEIKDGKIRLEQEHIRQTELLKFLEELQK